MLTNIAGNDLLEAGEGLEYFAPQVTSGGAKKKSSTVLIMTQRRRELEHPSKMPLQRCAYLEMFMDGVVVSDGVDQHPRA